MAASISLLVFLRTVAGFSVNSTKNLQLRLHCWLPQTMGPCNSKEAEVSARQKKLNDDLDRIEKDKEAERQRALDAETIPLNMNGPDGRFSHDARLNGTIQELTEKVVLKLGLTKECAELVEMHLSGYKLEPVTKIVREFTELCAVILGWCSSRE